jgi:NAD(P)-dependent dehydrogenase (short-subunit alcohol dehydrogenase family)
MSGSLSGQRALVTAGGAGIGKAVARTLAEAGARVHICDIDEAALTQTLGELPDLSGSQIDIADEAGVDGLFDALEADFGGLDILVNCAGISGPTGPIETIEPADWRQTLAVSLDGTYLCTRRAVPLLKAADGGSIVNFSSTAGLMGYPRRTPYAAAKWAIIGLTKSLAMELGPYRIRVNAICPGSVEGERMDRVIAAEQAITGKSAEEIRGDYTKASSLGTFVTAEDMAAMVLFVCSDAGAKVNGQALAVDGHTEAAG